MPKPSQSQWEFPGFGEPAPVITKPAEKPILPQPTEPLAVARAAEKSLEQPKANPLASAATAGTPIPTVTVSQLTSRIRRTLETAYGKVKVVGQISNLRNQTSGHRYFVLKDDDAQLACVLFRSSADDLGRATLASLKDGVEVVATGELTVYEARGQHQLIVSKLELLGIGALHAAFERLKAKLQTEGLFEPARKRPIPQFPARIGIVTSLQAAALQDVLHVIRKRDPGLQIVLAPARVQGEGAGAEIAAALGLLNMWSAQQPTPLDLILVTRGGGSLEDLWAFNEEVVARALAASALPTISAVGHEIDFTISDFVADKRCATPTLAAEEITQQAFQAREHLARLHARQSAAMANNLRRFRDALRTVSERLARAHPRRRLREDAQTLDVLADRLSASLHRSMEDRRRTLARFAQLLQSYHPRRRLADSRQRMAQFGRRLTLASANQLQHARKHLESLRQRLEILAPQQTMRRGYAIVLRTEDEKVVKSPADVSPGEALRVLLADGEIKATVKSE